jgi:starch phosphorylase
VIAITRYVGDRIYSTLSKFMVQPPFVAYFSMEIGLESGMSTYSGGLGVLAGDKIRSAADLEVPMLAVSLLQRRGYFF